MKIVQIGILIALLVVAGLLYRVYRGQQQPAQVEQPQAAVQAEPPAPSAQPPATPTTPAATETASGGWKPAPKPSPAPKARPVSRDEKASATTVEQSPAVKEEPQQPAPSGAAATPAVEPGPAAAVAPLPPPPPRQVTLDAGTLISVRLAETLASDRVAADDTFQATLDKPIVVDGLVIAERGARLEGKIADVQQAGRVRGVAALGVELTRLYTSDGQKVDIKTQSFRKTAEKDTKSDAAKIGVGAAVGAAIGAIAGGGKGAAIGAAAGGGAGTGAVMATRGKPAVIEVETRIDFRLAESVTITEKKN